MPSVTPGYTFTGTTDPITYTKLNLLAQPTVAAIAANDVTTSTIANDAVTTVKILDSNVTTTKINDLAVTTGKIAAHAVTLAKVVAATSNNTFLARSTAGAGHYEAVDTTTTGLGFYTGAGGMVTQLTSKATAFTLDAMCGQITTSNASLNANTSVSSTWTNNKIAATDVVIINHKSGGNLGDYTINVACLAGSATLTIRSIIPAGALTDTLVLNFVVIKGVTA
jgi:ribosomal protein L31